MERKQIITRAEGKTICNIRETKTDMDLTIDHLIMVATEQIERATGRSLTYQTFVELFPTKRTIDMSYDDSGWSHNMTSYRVKDSSFYLSGLNVDPLTLDVRYDPSRVFDMSTALSPVDYYLDADNGKLTIMTGTRQASNALQVSYAAGWVPQPDDNVTEEDGTTHPLTLTDTIPFAIKEACLLQVAYLYARRRPDNIGLTGDRSHGKADQYVQTLAWGSKMGLAPEVVGLVRDLKKPVLGRY